MRNAQWKLGYNVQISVDSEYSVSADIFQDGNDVWTLVPFQKTMVEKLQFRYPSVTAHSGYGSEEDYTYLRAETSACTYLICILRHPLLNFTDDSFRIWIIICKKFV